MAKNSRIIRDDYTRMASVYVFNNKSDARENFAQFISNVRDHGEVEVVRSDNGEEFTGGKFVSVCKKHLIKREFTTTDSTPI